MTCVFVLTRICEIEVYFINMIYFYDSFIRCPVSLVIDDAVLRVLSKVTSALDYGNKALAVFLELSKPFDTVSHGLLLKKLSSLDIDSTALGWFRSFLSARTQQVVI